VGPAREFFVGDPELLHSGPQPLRRARGRLRPLLGGAPRTPPPRSEPPGPGPSQGAAQGPSHPGQALVPLLCPYVSLNLLKSSMSIRITRAASARGRPRRHSMSKASSNWRPVGDASGRPSRRAGVRIWLAFWSCTFCSARTAFAPASSRVLRPHQAFELALAGFEGLDSQGANPSPRATSAARTSRVERGGLVRRRAPGSRPGRCLPRSTDAVVVAGDDAEHVTARREVGVVRHPAHTHVLPVRVEPLQPVPETDFPEAR